MLLMIGFLGDCIKWIDLHDQAAIRSIVSNTIVFCSLTSCSVEHSLGVVPSLFALCIAHWFTSLSTLARCDEPGLNFWL